MPMHGKKKTKKMSKGGATKMRYGGMKTKKCPEVELPDVGNAQSN